MMNRQTSTAIRSSLFYAIHFAALGGVFSYYNVALIERGFTGMQIGLFSSLNSAIILLASPLLTGLADKKNWHRQILLAGNIGFAVAFLGMHFPQTFLAFLPFPILTAMFGAPSNPLTDAMIVRMVNTHNLNLGKVRVWGSIGSAISSILMGFLLDHIGLRLLFIAGGCILLCRAFAVPLLDPIQKKETAAPVATPRKTDWLAPLKDSLFLLFLLAIFLWGCTSSGFFTYSGIYMRQMTDQSVLIGMMNALPALVEVITVLLSDRLYRRFGQIPMLVAGIGIFISIVFITLFITNPVVLVIVNALRGLGFGLMLIVTVRFVDSRAPLHLKGTYQSVYGLASFTVPSLMILPLLGYLYDTFSIKAVFLFGIFTGLAAIIILLIMGKIAARQHPIAKPQAAIE